jgi:hypothetical protein
MLSHIHFRTNVARTYACRLSNHLSRPSSNATQTALSSSPVNTIKNPDRFATFGFHTGMPPTLGKLARRALITAGPAMAQPHLHTFERRGLGVNHTQGVTLGVLIAYVVVIALLWNLPYVRWVLWPFKVRQNSQLHVQLDASSSQAHVTDNNDRCL